MSASVAWDHYINFFFLFHLEFLIVGFCRKMIIFTFGLIWSDGSGNLEQEVFILRVCFYWLYLGLVFLVNLVVLFIWLWSSTMMLLFCRPYLDSWVKLAMNRSWLMNLKLNVTSSFRSYTLPQRQLRCFCIFTPCIFFNRFMKLFCHVFNLCLSTAFSAAHCSSYWRVHLC